MPAIAIMDTTSTNGKRTIPAWTFGDRVRKARRAAGMSQQQLADAIGVKVGSVSSWEADTATPRDTLAVVSAIAEAVEAIEGA